MEITYDKHDPDAPRIKLSESDLEIVKSYALMICKKFQVADEKYADCWNACGISFRGIQPVFTWGAIEDFDPEDYEIFVND